MNRIYRRLRPLPIHQKSCTLYVDRSLWSHTSTRLHIVGHFVDYRFLQSYIQSLGQKTNHTYHTWFLEDSILESLYENTYEVNDTLFLVQRTWFNTSQSPTHALHCINVFPEDGTLPTGTIWNTLNHNEWSPNWN